MKWNKDVFNEMALIASRSPSVHNVQPWKMKFTDNGFDLYQSHRRRLFVGDPKLHDNDVSLGSFIELCSLFLETCGLVFSLVEDRSEVLEDGEDKYEKRFRVLLTEVESKTDKLFSFVQKRRSHRGLFKYDSSFDYPLLSEMKTPGLELKWITGPEEMKKWSALYDESSSQINQGPGYFKELIHWLRFSESDPGFNQDGLNRKALALSAPEAWAGKLLFRESVFKILSMWSMEKILISEAPQIKSAQGILVIYAKKNLSSLEMGRAFVRCWLELTSRDLYACPLSALVDFTHTNEILNSMKLSNDTICLNVLRFGKVADEKIIYSSPRLDVDRIIIK